jgi:hypothetical protein
MKIAVFLNTMDDRNNSWERFCCKTQIHKIKTKSDQTYDYTKPSNWNSVCLLFSKLNSEEFFYCFLFLLFFPLKVLNVLQFKILFSIFLIFFKLYKHVKMSFVNIINKRKSNGFKHRRQIFDANHRSHKKFCKKIFFVFFFVCSYSSFYTLSG